VNEVIVVSILIEKYLKQKLEDHMLPTEKKFLLEKNDL
jgi:hypothetical protein